VLKEGDAVPPDEDGASGALRELVFPGSLAYDALTTLVGKKEGRRRGKGRRS
jgi:hypothetical protein